MSIFNLERFVKTHDVFSFESFEAFSGLALDQGKFPVTLPGLGVHLLWYVLMAVLTPLMWYLV